ncbi:MAG: hypothetical protein RLZ55_669 [Actinomycetota bacterium]
MRNFMSDLLCVASGPVIVVGAAFDFLEPGVGLPIMVSAVYMLLAGIRIEQP